MPERTAIVVYPLEQVLAVKRRRAEAAEREAQEAQSALKREQEQLQKAQEQRNKVKQHYTDKLNQLRNILDHESRTDDLQLARNYVNLVANKLRTEEERVQKQQYQVDAAEAAFEMAKQKWKKHLKEVEKIDKHRKEWMYIALKESRKQEDKEIEEVGTLMYLSARMNPDKRSVENDFSLF